MSDLIRLAHGQVNRTDAIDVLLVRPADMAAVDRTLVPPVVRIVWPPHPTEIPPRHFTEAAAMLTRLFAEAATALAQFKAQKREPL